MVTLRPLQAARQSLVTEALQAPRRETELLQWAPARRPLGFESCSSSHCMCCPQLTGHTFPWTQVRRTVRDMSPITLTSLLRARKGSLWINMSREAQHKAGVAGGVILVCATLWGFPIETLQCKDRRREGHQEVLGYQSAHQCLGHQSQKWFLACRPWFYTQKPLASQAYSPQPWGTLRKRHSLAKQFLTAAFSLCALNMVLWLTCVIP